MPDHLRTVTISAYTMHRTTVYLTDQLRADLKRTARAQGRSEAELIREGIRAVISAPRPRIPLFDSRSLSLEGDLSDLAERVDENLRGFGES